MIVNNRAKGRRNELRAKKALEALGYTVELAKPSSRFQRQNDLWGLWDCVAVRQDDVRCIQVKSNSSRPSLAWRVAAKSWKAPAYFTRELWIYKDRQKEPTVMVL